MAQRKKKMEHDDMEHREIKDDRMQNDTIRYYKCKNSFFLRGRCKIYSAKDNLKKEETTIFIHSGKKDSPPQGTGLLTSIPIQYLCIFKAPQSTLFTIASDEDVQIIFHHPNPLPDVDMLAISDTIHDTLVSDLNYPIQNSMNTIISYSLSDRNEEVISLNFIKEIIIHGVQRAKQHIQNRPSFQIFIPHEGESKKEVPKGQWHEWVPEGCPYHPCHDIKNQICDYCYCPFYPCYDEELGMCVTSSKGGKIWSCEPCTLLHYPSVAGYLKKHPMAELRDLKRIHAEHPDEK